MATSKRSKFNNPMNRCHSHSLLRCFSEGSSQMLVKLATSWPIPIYSRPFLLGVKWDDHIQGLVVLSEAPVVWLCNNLTVLGTAKLIQINRTQPELGLQGHSGRCWRQSSSQDLFDLFETIFCFVILFLFRCYVVALWMFCFLLCKPPRF